MGSAGIITDGQLELARRLGAEIARRGGVVVTGACPGLPHVAGTLHEQGAIPLQSEVGEGAFVLSTCDSVEASAARSAAVVRSGGR